MSETRNAANRIGLFHDAAGPDMLTSVADAYAASSLVTIKRRIISTLSKRNPDRSAAGVRNLISAWSLEWDWPVTAELSNLYRVCEGFGDAGRGEAITGGYRWRISKGGTPCGFGAVLDGIAGGTRYEGRRGIFTDATLTCERTSGTKMETSLQFLEFDEKDTAPDLATRPAPGRLASSLGTACSVDGDAAQTVFSVVLGFQREATPAGFDEAGVGSSWLGKLTPDVAGRIVCRLDSTRLATAFLGEGLTVPVVLSLTLPGGALFKVTMPACFLKVSTRVHIDDNLYEYSVDFAALENGTDDAVVMELTT